ncbi:MAG: hypothetical protein SFU57_00605 [Gemmatimonadales bacterium]|nr:hypothetical protein [Gemmatimonadales bacterium]
MTELVQTLEQMTAVLTSCGESFWSKKIASDLSLLQKGDNYGVERFLTYFGGMGSINDVWLCRVNGHSVPEERESETNAEFHRLRERAWKLARAAVANDS